MLGKTEPRCAAIYNIGGTKACPDRDLCLRYLSFRHLDLEAGIEHYRDILVMMGKKDCEMFMEAQ